MKYKERRDKRHCCLLFGCLTYLPMTVGFCKSIWGIRCVNWSNEMYYNIVCLLISPFNHMFTELTINHAQGLGYPPITVMQCITLTVFSALLDLWTDQLEWPRDCSYQDSWGEEERAVFLLHTQKVCVSRTHRCMHSHAHARTYAHACTHTHTHAHTSPQHTRQLLTWIQLLTRSEMP